LSVHFEFGFNVRQGMVLVLLIIQSTSAIGAAGERELTGNPWAEFSEAMKCESWNEKQTEGGGKSSVDHSNSVAVIDSLPLEYGNKRARI
jgi:hypothetical protein